MWTYERPFSFSRKFNMTLFFLQADFNKKNSFYVFNHVDIRITYHSGGAEGWKGARLVAATMEPRRYVCVAWSTGHRVTGMMWKMCCESRDTFVIHPAENLKPWMPLPMNVRYTIADCVCIMFFVVCWGTVSNTKTRINWRVTRRCLWTFSENLPLT